MGEFPASWVLLPVSEAVRNVTLTDKKIPQKNYLPSGKFPVFDQGQDYVGGYTDDAAMVIDCELPAIVFGDHTRVVKLVNIAFAPGADGVKVLEPSACILPKLLEHFARYLVTKIPNNGYARHYQHLAKSLLPIPPLAEQHRIVAKIEELFSELDQGVASLKTAREQLKVYRQSLLKNAFEGKLTAAWRAAHADQLETATALQQRIARERQARYQQQLADWQTAGQAGPKPNPPKPLPPLTAEELAELPELPVGWGWFKLAGVSDVSGGLTKNQKREQLSLTRPYLRVANVYANRLELGEIHSIGVTESELERVTLEKGDLLIVEGNGSIDQIGRVALWADQISACVHQNHIIKARPLRLAVSKFLLYFLMSELGRKFIVRAASSTSGLHTLSISKVEGLFVPLCSSDEQTAVIAELESKLSEADQLDQTLATALQQADALRQSILKKAFCGQLVDQDKNDEPVTALLERIRAARAASPAKGRQAKLGSKSLTNC
jgi:type I restriction enzyme S subunit